MLLLIGMLACNNPLEDSAIPADCAQRAAFYPDADGDGAGSGAAVYVGCEAPGGYVTVAGDCDDADPAVQSGCDSGGDSGADSGSDSGTDSGSDSGADSGSVTGGDTGA